MFTKTSGSKRFTSGISRFFILAFSVRLRTIMYGAYVSNSVNLTLDIFVQWVIIFLDMCSRSVLVMYGAFKLTKLTESNSVNFH
jgi:hypothetical protein